LELSIDPMSLVSYNLRIFNPCTSSKEKFNMFRFFIGIAILTFSAFFAHADDLDMGTIADENGCKVYNPMPQQGESISWEAASMDSQMDQAHLNGSSTDNSRNIM
jgi:hypothetical protein